MPISLRKGLNRRPPEIPENPELARHIRLAAEDAERKTRDLADQVPGSKHDFIEFTVPDDGIIRLTNKFGFVPKMREVCYQDGAGSIWSNGKLADKDFIYLETDAEPGTRFVVRFF